MSKGFPEILFLIAIFLLQLSGGILKINEQSTSVARNSGSIVIADSAYDKFTTPLSRESESAETSGPVLILLPVDEQFLVVHPHAHFTSKANEILVQIP